MATPNSYRRNIVISLLQVSRDILSCLLRKSTPDGAHSGSKVIAVCFLCGGGGDDTHVRGCYGGRDLSTGESGRSSQERGAETNDLCIWNCRSCRGCRNCDDSTFLNDWALEGAFMDPRSQILNSPPVVVPLLLCDNGTRTAKLS